jgi:hypothetical protein
VKAIKAIRDPSRCVHDKPVGWCTACEEALKALKVLQSRTVHAGSRAGKTMQVLGILDECDDCDDDDDGEWWPCWGCDGEGTVHDCGEDVCNCIAPELDDQVTCEECEGRGGSSVPWEFR